MSEANSEVRIQNPDGRWLPHSEFCILPLASTSGILNSGF